jgi:hypothetical protein
MASKVSFTTAKAMYEYLTTEPIPTLEEFCGQYCPDVSKYEGKVLICMSCDFRRGGSWECQELLDAKDWKRFPMNLEIYLGEVNGKHSEVERPLEEILDDVIEDPYDIWEAGGGKI